MTNLNKFLAKAKEMPANRKGRYEIYNLTENPFPASPFVIQESTDARYNGDIYEPSIRHEEFDRVGASFLKVPRSDPNHLRLGYIVDTSYIGRGNGKSAFLVNLQKEVNRDFCLTLSNGFNKCFAVTVSPEPAGRTKTFYSFVDLVANTIFRSSVINDSLATLRLEAILSLDKEFKAEVQFASEEDLRNKLDSETWFEEKKLDLRKINEIVLSNTYLQGLPTDFPLRRSLLPVIEDAESFEKYYFSLKRGAPRLEFVFSHLVSLLLAAGFNGAYIFVDDFERIPDFQSERQKRDFALELRSCLFDGLYTNCRFGFYTFLLVLHAGVPRLVQKAWDESGLERRAPIFHEKTPKHVIRFEKITLKHAYLLVKRYLNEYRIDSAKTDSLFPFTENAIAKIAELSELNASEILKRAYESLERAVDQEVSKIDADFIQESDETSLTQQKQSSGIHEAPTVDLLKKALGE